MRELSRKEILELATSYRQSRVLLSAIELGVFDALGNDKKNSAAIAAELDLNPRATDRLLNALCVLGVLRKENGVYFSTDDAKRTLCRESAGYFPGLHHSIHLWKSWGQLTEVVRTGKPADVPERKDPNWTEAFIGAMEGFAVMRAPMVLDEVDLEGISSVLDIGGGSGAYSLEIARRVPGARAVIFDLPDVTALTREYIEKTPLKGRVTAIDGDYLTDELPQGFDMVLLSNIIHSQGPDEIKDLFGKCRNALKNGGRVMIQEFIVDEERNSPSVPVLFAINMLVNTRAGDTYTEGEIRTWLQEEGFVDIVRKDTPVDSTLILARKP